MVYLIIIYRIIKPEVSLHVEDRILSGIIEEGKGKRREGGEERETPLSCHVLRALIYYQLVRAQNANREIRENQASVQMYS